MRLIDADALKTKLEKMIAERRDWNFDSLLVQREIVSLNDALHEVLSAPTIDAVEVVRCKDCVAWYENKKEGDGWCGVLDEWTPSNWFCADGERREDNG